MKEKIINIVKNFIMGTKYYQLFVLINNLMEDL